MKLTNDDLSHLDSRPRRIEAIEEIAARLSDLQDTLERFLDRTDEEPDVDVEDVTVVATWDALQDLNSQVLSLIAGN